MGSTLCHLPTQTRHADADTLCRLLAYPLGRLAAAVLPVRHYDLPKFLGGGQFSLNPGR